VKVPTALPPGLSGVDGVSATTVPPSDSVTTIFAALSWRRALFLTVTVNVTVSPTLGCEDEEVIDMLSAGPATVNSPTESKSLLATFAALLGSES